MMMIQFIFLQEGSDRIYQRPNPVSCSHMNCCLQKYITHQFTFFIYYSLQNKLKKILELQESIKYIKSYQQSKIVILDELVFYLYFI